MDQTFFLLSLLALATQLFASATALSDILMANSYAKKMGTHLLISELKQNLSVHTVRADERVIQIFNVICHHNQQLIFL
ncbi:predicted protein [Histoplasma mississippiense (nom. inval.)]|uniref:predicted protein n=1 Tax=Ajellomyces capsulatus (strain NAm1 / WU24) TaxID=2059318 RepID=UPI000157B627|nr:predicted protein [Histoplasma mississippiense (nom. inval.)]EDN02440.1 predicted protein [Histoplasma mississippiense (nom. inval.)]